MDITIALPAECISNIISLTTPRDACRLSVVSPVFKSAADSDSVWENFLPSDYKQIISNSVSSLITSLSKKDLYFHLCRNPIIINNGTMPESGKKCYMVGTKGLSIAWGDEPNHWILTSLPESRFPEVAELKYVWWFDVKAMIETRILSLRTNYTAYLVFKFVESKYGFARRPVDSGVYIEGSDNGVRRRLLLDPSRNMARLSQDRRDGWIEIEMGEFFNENGDDGKLVCSLFEFDSFITKRGLIIQGIEVRPKSG
ncbi:F-box protein PP2-B10 [Citrus sinensis]|uniref:F-box protein PP2-B10 n=1 Tax=Citrus sinensis TaxID=2711 RepID=A0ACB8I1J7_CITSI|nr:F-box protein PP2-B10 [Citrus sinensis]